MLFWQVRQVEGARHGQVGAKVRLTMKVDAPDKLESAGGNHMAQRKPEKLSLDQVLKLVDELSPDEQEELRSKLNRRSWGQRWEQLSKEVQSRFSAAGVPIPTEEEVMAEVKAVRDERKARRAQSSH